MALLGRKVIGWQCISTSNIYLLFLTISSPCSISLGSFCFIISENSSSLLYVPVRKSQRGSFPTSRVPELRKAPRLTCAAVSGSSLSLRLPVHFADRYGNVAAREVKATQPIKTLNVDLLSFLLLEDLATCRFSSRATCSGILCEAI